MLPDLAGGLRLSNISALTYPLRTHSEFQVEYGSPFQGHALLRVLVLRKRSLFLMESRLSDRSWIFWKDLAVPRNEVADGVCCPDEARFAKRESERKERVSCRVPDWQCTFGDRNCVFLRPIHPLGHSAPPVCTGSTCRIIAAARFYAESARYAGRALY